MIRFKDFIPVGIKNYVRLLHLKTKYKNCSINTRLISNDVKLGYNVRLSRDSDIRNNVEIGDYSYVNVNTVIASAKVGKFTSIGYNCQIGMHEHPTNYLAISNAIYGKNNIINNKEIWEEVYSPPMIGNDVWIGSNVVILQGVKIGDGAIVAAGAVVTKDVESYSIAGGVPAKLIKMRFGKEEIKYLQDLRWWDMPIDELKNYRAIFEKRENWFEAAKSI